MKKLKEQQVTSILNKIDKGIWEAKKWRAKEITKSILTAIWTVTVFPLILLYMFVTEN